MKKSYPIKTILLASGLMMITGCADTVSSISGAANSYVSGGSVSNTTSKTYAPTNPTDVAIYYGDTLPHRHYVIIGRVSANADDMLGLDKSEQSIRTVLQQKAASIGGEAVIHVQEAIDTQSGDVIRFHR